MAGDKDEVGVENDVYEWVDPGDMGVRKDVSVGDLRVDRSYQRDEIPSHTDSICKHFNWAAFGVIVVVQRASGVYYVVDGQQRVAAFRQRVVQDAQFAHASTGRVPCVVFQSRGREQEAHAFRQLNMWRRPVDAYNKYTSAVVAKLPLYTAIDSWLKDQGLKVKKLGGTCKTPDDHNCVTFPSALVTTWRRDQTCCCEAIRIQRYITHDAQRVMCADVHKGLWYILNDGLALDVWQEKLKKAGVASLQESINHESVKTRKGKGELCCAWGIVDVINLGLRGGKRLSLSNTR